MSEIKIFAPATIANVSCGFDVLGICLENVGDEMIVRKSAEKGIRITKIVGQELPLATEKNVAGVAGMAFLQNVTIDHGFEIEIYKKIKAGSGIGSSAASAAGTVFAMNELLNKPFSKQKLVAFAMQGEKLASGAAHADNVAPALLGNMTLIKSYDPLDIVTIPVPGELFATVIHPQIEVKTADARSVLKRQIPLQKVVTQLGNLGGLICGCYTADYDLIGRSLHDEVIEPLRSILIPGFSEVKERAIASGALGAGISGSGPSIFALSKGKETAVKVADAISEVYQTLGIDFDIHVSPIHPQGCQIL